MNKVDEILEFHAQGRMGAISLAQHDKVQQYAKSALHQLFIGSLPEKRLESVLCPPYRHQEGQYQECLEQNKDLGYNHSRDEMKQAIDKLFKGEK